MTTRDEALRHAIKCAEQAESVMISAPMTDALAHLAEAWLAIHDRLPAVDADVTETNPPPKGLLPPAMAADIGMCEHRRTVYRINGHWSHIPELTECDAPPVFQPDTVV